MYVDDNGGNYNYDIVEDETSFKIVSNVIEIKKI